MSNESLSQGIQYNENNFVFTAENAYPGSVVEQSVTDGDAVRRVERTQAAKTGSDGAGGDFDLVLGKKDGIGGLSSVNICRESAVGGTYFVGLSIEPGATISSPCTISSPGGISITDLVSDSVRLSTLTLANQPTGYAITTSDVDTYGAVVASQTTAGQTYTIDNPTNTTASLMFVVINSGSANFQLDPLDGSGATITVGSGKYQMMFWDGSTWIATSSGSGSSSGVSGSVQYSDGAGGFLSDASNFFYDAVTHTLKLSQLLGISDGAWNVGSSSNRAGQNIANAFKCYIASGAANPTLQLDVLGLRFGPGGASSFDVKLSRSSTPALVLDNNAGGAVANIPFTANPLYFGVYDGVTHEFGPQGQSWMGTSVVIGNTVPTFANIGAAAPTSVVIGNNSGSALTSAAGTVLIGDGIASSATSLIGCVGIGSNTFHGANNISACIAIGNALTSATSGISAIAIGNGALSAGVAIDRNVAIGAAALQNAATSTFDLVAIGHQAAQAPTAVNRSVFIGSGATSSGAGTHAGRIAIGMSSGGVGANATIDNGLFFHASLANVGSGATNLPTTKVSVYNTSTGQMGPGDGYLGTLNVAFGQSAGSAVTTASGCVNIGVSAGKVLTTGNQNTNLGHVAGFAMIDAVNCTHVGYAAGNSIVTVGNQTAVGNSAFALATGSGNTGIGKSVGANIVAGVNNCFMGMNVDGSAPGRSGAIAIGVSAAGTSATATVDNGLFFHNSLATVAGAGSPVATTKVVAYNSSGQMGPSEGFLGTSNTGFGTAAGDSITTSVRNAFFGVNAGTSLAGGVGDNAGFGFNALGAIVTSQSCTAVGSNALAAHTFDHATAVGSNALAVANSLFCEGTAVGSHALQILTTGTSCTAMGSYALSSLTTNSDCTAVGWHAASGVTGASNTCVGKSAMELATSATTSVAIGANAIGTGVFTGSAGVAVGYQALKVATSATSCTAVGSNALVANTTGNNNTALGAGALAANVSNTQNVAIGHNALTVATADNNTAVGQLAMAATTTGTQSTAVGQNCLSGQTTGSRNSAFGCISMSLLTIGSDNSSFGRDVLNGLTTGNQNTAMGTSTGNALTTGSFNTLIGSAVTVSANNRVGSIAIGISSAGTGASATVDNGLFFHNSLATVAGTAVQYTAAGQMGPIVSSNRFKTDIQDIEVDTSLVYNLRPVSYNYSLPSMESLPREFGLIAEEVVELYPSIVPLDKDNLPCSVNYDRITVLLVAEIKKLRDRIVALENAG